MLETVATPSTLSWEEAVRWLLSQPQYAQVVRDCYYDQPGRLAVERYGSSDEWRAIRELMPDPPGLALDVGAGNGITSVALAMAGYSVVAVEPDPSGLVGRSAIADNASELGIALDVRDGTLERIPVADGQIDLVLARQVLHHAADLPAACRELFRVLKHGGLLVSVRDHVVTSSRQLPKFLAGHPLHFLYGGENAFRERDYVQALQGAGFSIRTRLRSFDSVINFAPHTRSSLRLALSTRVRHLPVAGSLIAALLNSDRCFDYLLTLMSVVDNRPGRLVSYVATKPS